MTPWEVLGQFLLMHADLVVDVIEFIASGGSKDSLKKAIRDLKVKISDQAMREELFQNSETD